MAHVGKISVHLDHISRLAIKEWILLVPRDDIHENLGADEAFDIGSVEPLKLIIVYSLLAGIACAFEQRMHLPFQRLVSVKLPRSGQGTMGWSLPGNGR